MYKALFLTHLISVIAFLLIYLIKTILLVANKDIALAKFSKVIKVPEMIVSALFLITGIYMLTQIPVINTFMIIKIVAIIVAIPLAVVGYKKKSKALAIISLVLIIAAYGLAEMSKKRGGKMKPPVENGAGKVAAIIDGENIYKANCASCHGKDGKLGLMGSQDLSATTMDVNSKISIVRDGKGAMQSFSSSLTEEEINAVVMYTETLKR